MNHGGIDKDAILKENRFGRRCQHNKFIVDEQLGEVECGICGDKLNPIWVLRHLCGEEARYYQRLSFLREEAEKAKAKNRCKCEKCGQMTRIEK